MTSKDPPICARNPKKKDKVKCNWCNKPPMLGNNFPNHVCVPAARYMSYTLVVPKGQTSIASMFLKATKEKEKIQVEERVEEPQPMEEETEEQQEMETEANLDIQEQYVCFRPCIR